MRRLFIQGQLQPEMVITGTDAHHLLHVMRARAGQELVVTDETGASARVAMRAFTAETVTVELLGHLASDNESPVNITLVQCLPKGDKLELVTQKAVELGAVAIQPVTSQNCVVRYDGKKAVARQERWQRIADEAAKQCGRTRLAKVMPICSLAQWLSDQAWQADDLLLFCYEREEQQSLRDALTGCAAKNIYIVIGPEGGFAAEEATLLTAAGAISVTLGPRILRTETAALAAISLVQYELGDLG